jgi:prepilin-type N-terminal cleavage/methylation domain-containing protein
MDRKKGFSLLELIIAIAVLAIGLVGVLQVFPIGLRLSQRAGMITKASFLAQNKMEDIKLAGFGAITEVPSKIALSGRDGDFEWVVKIDNVSLEGVESISNMRKIIVTVTWPEQNTTRSKEFITYVTKQ